MWGLLWAILLQPKNIFAWYQNVNLKIFIGLFILVIMIKIATKKRLGAWPGALRYVLIPLFLLQMGVDHVGVI